MPARVFAYLRHSLHAVTLITLVAILASASPIVALPGAAEAVVLYVDHDAVGLNDGTSWANAYTDLANALWQATSGAEIWVAEGTYRPTGSLDRAATFSLRSGIAVYGGFAGTESSRGERDWLAHPTILSGDIGTSGDTADNSYHVVTANAVDSLSLLDGFIIRDGYANGINLENGSRGGGMLCLSAQAVIRNVVFTANYAQGAVKYAGGALYNYLCTSTFINVAFIGNEARLAGGAVLNEGSSPTFVNTLFYNNAVLTPANGGTAVVNLSSAVAPEFRNVTIAGNVGSNMGILTSSAMLNDGTSPTIRNSIIWGNIPANLPFNNLNGASPTLSYTIIEGGYVGTANLDVDPIFRSLSTGDLRLGMGSPAIDSGLNSLLPIDFTDLDGDGDSTEPLPLDLDGYDRINGAAVDRGAYEALPDLVVSKTVTPLAVRSGDYVTYTLTFQNSGAIAACDVVLTDALDDNLGQRSWSSSGLTLIRRVSTFYTWDVEACIAPSQGGAITITAQVDPSAQGTFDLPNVFTAESSTADANYASNVASADLIVDNDPPLPPVLLTPANGAFINDSTPLLTWGNLSSDVVAHQVDVDGALYPTGSGTSFTPPALADGTHAWTVAAIDRVGFYSDYADEFTFTLDTVAPETLLTQTPISPTSEMTATFVFTGTDSGSGVAGFQCKLDSAAWASCTSPYTTPALPDGTHAFSVRAVDRAANTDLTPASASWLIDTLGPAAPALISPANNTITKTTQLDLTWSAVSDAARYELAINGVTTKVGLVTHILTQVLAEGVYTWTVQAYDALDNPGASATPFTFTIDTTAPAVPELVSPSDASVLQGRFQTLTWLPVAGATGYIVNLDATLVDVGNVSSWLTPVLLTQSHNWTVAAYDAAGNLSAYPLAWRFQITLYDTYLPIALRNQ